MRIPLYDQPTLTAIIKQGEERKKYGQTNKRATTEAEQRPRRYTVRRNTKAIEPEVAYHTRETLLNIVGILATIEIAKMHAMSDPDEWRRLTEVKTLAIKQLKDESGKWIYQVARVGRQEIEVYDTITEDSHPIWPVRTETQEMLSLGFDEYMVRLTETQEQTLRLRYWSQMTQQEVADYMHISKNSVKVNEARAKNALLRHFQLEWEDEIDDKTLQA